MIADRYIYNTYLREVLVCYNYTYCAKCLFCFYSHWSVIIVNTFFNCLYERPLIRTKATIVSLIVQLYIQSNEDRHYQASASSTIPTRIYSSFFCAIAAKTPSIHTYNTHYANIVSALADYCLLVDCDRSSFGATIYNEFWFVTVEHCLREDEQYQ